MPVAGPRNHHVFPINITQNAITRAGVRNRVLWFRLAAPGRAPLSSRVPDSQRSVLRPDAQVRANTGYGSDGCTRSHENGPKAVEPARAFVPGLIVNRSHSIGSVLQWTTTRWKFGAHSHSWPAVSSRSPPAATRRQRPASWAGACSNRGRVRSRPRPSGRAVPARSDPNRVELH